MKHLFFTAFALMCLCCPRPTVAGIYRHDKPASLFKELASQPQFACVGQLMDYSTGGSMKGSCVLIGERFVLTAAHLFMESEYRYDTVLFDGKKAVVNQPYNIRANTDVSRLFLHLEHRIYSVKAVKILPAYLDSATRSPSTDLALVELAEPVKAVTPIRLNHTFDELGDTLTGVGWGGSGPANDAESVGPWGEKIAGQNMIDSLGGERIKGQSALLVTDFDCPKGYASCNTVGSPMPLPLEYGVTGGDSGCGSFRKSARGWELIGILSTNGGHDMNKILSRIGYYGVQPQWVRIAVYVDWIEQQMMGAQKQQ